MLLYVWFGCICVIFLWKWVCLWSKSVFNDKTNHTVFFFKTVEYFLAYFVGGAGLYKVLLQDVIQHRVQLFPYILNQQGFAQGHAVFEVGAEVFVIQGCDLRDVETSTLEIDSHCSPSRGSSGKRCCNLLQGICYSRPVTIIKLYIYFFCQVHVSE